MPASIDVVIPVLDQYELTARCLQRLAEQTAAHRVIVVDDGCTDGTPERLAREWPRVSVVSQGTNQGFPRAVNRGVREGDGEVVVLLNNDVECRADFLELLVAGLQDHTVGLAAATLLRPDHEVIDCVGLSADVTLAAFSRQHGQGASHAGDERPALLGPSGGAGAYRRSAWEQVGGMDESLFAYMEDVDLALRLRAAGWRAVAVPEAIAIHLGSAFWGHRSAKQRRQGGFARGYMLRRYGVLRTHAALRALLSEAIVVAGDTVISRDTVALASRLAGWRAAREHPRLPFPSREALDSAISTRQSLQLRRRAYARSG